MDSTVMPTSAFAYSPHPGSGPPPGPPDATEPALECAAARRWQAAIPIRWVAALGCWLGLLLAPAAAYEETNVVPFDPSFEANLWGIASQPLWQIGQTLHVNNQSPSASDTNDGSVGLSLIHI